MSLNVRGAGPYGGEAISGTFLFDSFAGTISSGTLSGTGLVSESWTIQGSFPGLAGSAGPCMYYSYSTACYLFNMSSFIGSMGDPASWSMWINSNGGSAESGGGSGPNLNSIDSWAGTVSVDNAPEPGTLLLFGTGALIAGIIRRYRSR